MYGFPSYIIINVYNIKNKNVAFLAIYSVNNKLFKKYIYKYIRYTYGFPSYIIISS